MTDYAGTWGDVKALIDSNYKVYPRHQGITDVTEVIDFHLLAGEWGLTQRQYDQLINKAQKYLDKKYREESK